MSGATWKHDPKLIRDQHKWVFESAEGTDFGATLLFSCANPGCVTTRSIAVTPHKNDFSGICFDRSKAVQLTDRNGDPIGREE